jgi:DNA-binding GntR family transcriptional regulator
VVVLPGQSPPSPAAALTRILSRLAEDGLIAKNKGHGCTFLPTFDSLVSLKGSYEFRLTLEPACFLLPTFKPDLAAIERMRLQHLYLISDPDIATVSGAQLFETDAAFHEMCAEFCGNAFFVQAIQHQNRLRRLLEFGSYANSRRVQDWCREHVTIIEAIRNRRSEPGLRQKCACISNTHWQRHQVRKKMEADDAVASQGDRTPVRSRN